MGRSDGDVDRQLASQCISKLDLEVLLVVVVTEEFEWRWVSMLARITRDHHGLNMRIEITSVDDGISLAKSQHVQTI